MIEARSRVAGLFYSRDRDPDPETSTPLDFSSTGKTIVLFYAID